MSFDLKFNSDKKYKNPVAQPYASPTVTPLSESIHILIYIPLISDVDVNLDNKFIIAKQNCGSPTRIK
ncbi:hypothetical protein VAZ01S_016_00590 [Vibrio azureus NBRC 104587]|uniref:Uncharacterized protein n=1 Tax=Vibrio azureus NBRC 104587 TaxID=1219077 RepID=U3C032_9VIBR|nr:hypothetical protein VAZ01S_016_00590 [Vibrio azureus NBRC 104587]